MLKERYVKPEVTSEVLEPGALGTSGSPAGGGDVSFPVQIFFPSFGFCCK